MATASKVKKEQKFNPKLKKYSILTELELKELETLSKYSMKRVESRFKTMQKEHKALEQFDGAADCEYDLVPYYDKSVDRVTKQQGYSVLAYQGRRGKNWIHMRRLWELCRDNGYDYKIFIDAQFDTFKSWGSKFDFPPPNTMYSARAVRAYENYVYHNSTKVKREGWSGKLNPKSENQPQGATQDIQRSISLVEYDYSNLLKRFPTEAPAAHKANAIAYNWSALAPEYLATQYGFMEYIGDPDSWPDVLQDKIEQVIAILQNRSYLTQCHLAVVKAERKTSVPKRPDFSTMLPDAPEGTF